MKIIIVQNSPEAQRLTKHIQLKCSQRQLIPYPTFEKVFDLTDPNSWKLAVSLFYLFGAQRYSGNRTPQDPLSICKKGAARIVEILANFGQNCDSNLAVHGQNTIEAHVEGYYVQSLLTTETVDSVISAWNKIVSAWGYEVVKMFEGEKDYFTKIVVRPKEKTKITFPGSKEYREAHQDEESL